MCLTCKGTALVLAVENDGRLCFEECPDCNGNSGSSLCDSLSVAVKE